MDQPESNNTDRLFAAVTSVLHRLYDDGTPLVDGDRPCRSYTHFTPMQGGCREQINT